MVLKSIGVLSAAKLSGILGVLGGLIAGGMFAIFSMVGMLAGAQQNGPQVPVAVFGIASIVFLPIMYGIFGFISGALYAAVYNVQPA